MTGQAEVNLSGLTIQEFTEIQRFRDATADALAQMTPSLVLRAGLLPIAEILGVVDQWETTRRTRDGESR